MSSHTKLLENNIDAAMNNSGVGGDEKVMIKFMWPPYHSSHIAASVILFASQAL